MNKQELLSALMELKDKYKKSSKPFFIGYENAIDEAISLAEKLHSEARDNPSNSYCKIKQYNPISPWYIVYHD